jgi:putative Holliday junction resolvase
MSKYLGVDFGLKRIGLSITDQEKIFAFPLTTIEHDNAFNFFKDFFLKEEISKVIIGYPKRLSGDDSDIESSIKIFITKFKKQFPEIEIERFDERFTSKLASKAIVSSGLGKKKRSDKSLIDKVSAAIILQDYLTYNKSNL